MTIIKSNLRGLYHVIFRLFSPERYHKKYKRNQVDQNALFEIDGILLSLNKKADYQITLIGEGKYEEEVRLLFKHLIKPGSICFDIGANIGYFSLLFSKLSGPNGLVYAFEPVEYLFKKLTLHKYINKIENLFIYNFALGNTNGKVKINQVKENSPFQGNSSIALNEKLSKELNSHLECKDIVITKIDTFIEEHNIKKVDFIKIDVEGYELEVLKGAESVIRKMRPVLILEYITSRIEYIGNTNAEFKNLLYPFYDSYELCEIDYSNPNKSLRKAALEPFLFNRPLCGNLVCIPKESL